MGNKIGFGVETQKSMKKVSEENIASIKNVTKDLFDNLCNAYNETGDKNLYEVIKTLYTFYFGDFKTKIKRICDDWGDDKSASIVSQLKKTGQNATIETGKKVQNDIKEKTSVLFDVNFELPKIIELKDKVDPNKLWDKVGGIAKKYDKEIDTLFSTCKKKCTKEATENQYFKSISGLLQPIYKGYFDLSDKVYKGFNKERQYEIEMLKAKDKDTEIGTENLNRKAKDSASGFLDKLKSSMGDINFAGWENSIGKEGP